MSPNHWFTSASAVSDLITIQRFLDDRVFVTAEGGYGATFVLDGIDPECLSEQELQATSLQLMQVQRMLPEEAVLQQILVKHRTSDLPTSKYADSADNAVSETQRRRAAFLTTRKLGSIRLFWTAYMAPPKQSGKAPADQSATSKRLLRQLASVAGLVQANLTESLGLRWMDAHEIAQVYGFMASLDKSLSPRKLTAATHVAQQLSSCSVQWKEDGLQIGRRQARLFSLLRRPTSTRPHLFGDLLRLDVDLVLVLESQRRSVEKTRQAVTSHQSFKDLFRHSLLTVVAHAKGGKEISKSAQTVAADRGVDELGSIIDDIENRGLGYVEFSLIGLLHSSDAGELDDQMAQVHRVFSRSEASLLEEGIGSLSAYCALFPGAAKYGQPMNVRRWWLRDDHLANLSLVYAPYQGEAWSESLEDESLCVFETRDRTAFHYDPYHNAVRGMLVIASTRRGKSFLINFLVDNEPKYGGFLYIFDVGGSFESTVIKHNGAVVRFGIDGPRLNLFALAPEERNIDFVYRLIRLLLLKGGAVLQPSSDRDLFERVRSLFELPLELRRLKHLILSPELQPYLSKWIEGGVYGKVFDNIEDELTLKRIVSFDFQSITGEQADLMEPLLFWIKWRIANVTHDAGNLGVPKLEVYDEVWKHMQDPGMLSMMISSGKTAGKHLGGIILATQAADDLGVHSRVIRNSCSDTLFLGGPFDREQFTELFGLHERQLDLITSLQRGESLLVRANYSKVLVLNVDDESAWHYTTRPKDRQRRELAIQKHGRKEAFKHLMAEATPK